MPEKEGIESKGVHWYFKDSVQTNWRNPHIWYAAFFQRKFWDWS